MGNFSRDTFDKLKHYIGVRMQQGVPLVDADWNEQEDIKKYELQTFLKWFVGNGVPDGNDGFRIIGDGLENDFIIKGGDGTAERAGRCLVEGWDVMIKDDIRYTEQKLFLNEDDEANKWGVEPLALLSPPSSGERINTVYLDVWEREVDAQEDDNLVNPVIGIETCVRLKREWVVRVAVGVDAADLPTASNGHVYYPLAHLKRTAGKDIIEQDDITDLRMTGLSMISQHDFRQIITDAYGSSYTLDHDGQPNLKVSLRDAVNAILRGTLPGPPPQPLTSDASNDSYPNALEDRNGDTWVFWRSNRAGTWDIWYNRCINGEWQNDTQLPNETGDDSEPFALEDRSGNIWLFWASKSKNTGKYDIYYNCFVDGEWQGSVKFLTSIKDEGDQREPIALEDSNGVIWVFWQSDRAGTWDIYCRCRESGDWGEVVLLTQNGSNNYRTSAVEDNKGNIWLFWKSERDEHDYLWYKCRIDGSWESEEKPVSNVDSTYWPFALKDRNGVIWVFWQTWSNDQNIWYTRFIDNLWEEPTQLTTDAGRDEYAFALEDGNGDIWVFWNSTRIGNYEIWYNRCVNGTWKGDKQLTGAAGGVYPHPVGNLHPVALEDSNGDIQVFWHSSIAGNWDIWHSSLIFRI